MRLGADGCIAVPQEVQKQLGWKPGDEVELRVDAGTLLVRNVAQAKDGADELISRMQGKGDTTRRTDEIMEMLRGRE
jgi:AbrB family looped-hinge helix DNA binding protein